MVRRQARTIDHNCVLTGGRYPAPSSPGNEHTAPTRGRPAAAQLARPDPRECHAFTLVELLVVIAIIAVLIGIVMPTLDSARSSARHMQCLSNFRQLGVGFDGYGNDFEDFFPLITAHDTRFVGRSRDQRYFNHFIAPYTQGTPHRYRRHPIFGTKLDTKDDWRGTVWICPEWDFEDPRAAPDARHFGYGMNVYLSPRNEDLDNRTEYVDRYFRQYQRFEFRLPAQRFLLGDKNAWRLWGGSNPYPRITAGKRRHLGGRGTNYLYIDGHGGFVRWQDNPITVGVPRANWLPPY